MPQRNTPVVRVRYLRKGNLERLDRFKFMRSLQPGGQGQLDVFRRKSNRELVVCKYVPHLGVDYLYGRGREDEPVEVKILRDFLPQHPRIMTFLDYSVYTDEIRFFYEYYAGGDVDGLIRTFLGAGQKVPELLIWQLFLQMSDALAFLHFGHGTTTCPPANFRAIIHRDIKPANILLRSPISPGNHSSPSFVLADFGYATRVEDIRTSKWQMCGTPQFQPPEGALGPATAKSDVWSLGATIYAAANDNQVPIGRMPSWYPNNSAGYTQWAKQPEAKAVQRLGNAYSQQLERLMFACFQYHADMRISSLNLLRLIEREFSPGGVVFSNTRPAI